MSDRIQWNKSHCARMDHGGCALVVGVKNNRIVKVKGDPEGYLNRGYICAKGVASPDRLTHPDRLRHPLKRIGERGEGKWAQVTWEEAVRTISDRLKGIKERDGAKSVAFCQGMPKGLEHFVLIRLANAFGSPNVVAVQDVCHAPREISGIHTCGFYPVADFHYPSELILLWGSNITSTNEEGEICSRFLDQIKKGTKLIVIDPRRTALAKKADLWLPLRPGTDNALALAFLNVIIEEGLYDDEFVKNWTYGFERLAKQVKAYPPEKMAEITWVPAPSIKEAARLYAGNRPAALQWGNPIEHTVHAFDTVRALLCAMALCGNLDVPGGNIQASEPNILGLGKFARADLLPSKRKEMIHAHHQTIPRLMTVPPAMFRRAVLEDIPYPVRAAYMQCCNPLLSYADSRKTYDALKKLDFLAVADIFMTPTASLADMVLPAATHFEFNDIGHYGLGHGYILARPQILDPPAECWSDIKILNELGKSMTSPDIWYDDHEGLLDEVLKPSGLDYDQFVEQGYLKGPEKFMKYLDKGFKTPTGKVELLLSQADQLNLSALPQYTGLPEENDPDYPLILFCSKSRYYLHSSYRWVERLRKKEPQPRADIHPETASRYNIEEGNDLVIETRRGAMTQVAHLTDAVHPDVVHAAYGWWVPKGEPTAGIDWETSNYNMVTSIDHIGKEFGTPNLKGIGCRIQRK